MHDNLDLPMLPSVDIYQLRCITNNISSFNKNIINYDYVIYGRIQKIAIKAERLNELIRNSIPILRIKLNYIIQNEINEFNTNRYNNDEYLSIKRKITTSGFLDDLIDVKIEIEKLVSKTRYALESLLVFHLNEPNKLKQNQYIIQKEILLNSKHNKQSKINELNSHLSIIIAAEDIILKNKLLDFFDKYFIGNEIIDAISLSPNKKDILKSAISYVRSLLSMVDDGLEFKKLVDVRIYLTDQLIELREEINSVDTNIYRLSQLMLLSAEITTIDEHKHTIVAQIELLKNYWDAWSHFISKKMSEQVLNVAQIISASQMLMTYMNDIEYQFQRQLPD